MGRLKNNNAVCARFKQRYERFLSTAFKSITVLIKYRTATFLPDYFKTASNLAYRRQNDILHRFFPSVQTLR